LGAYATTTTTTTITTTTTTTITGVCAGQEVCGGEYELWDDMKADFVGFTTYFFHCAGPGETSGTSIGPSLGA
jgi:hypothetical protein